MNIAISLLQSLSSQPLCSHRPPFRRPSDYTSSFAGHAMFGKTKTVKFTLRNDSSAPMEVKAGEDIIKLEAGKPVTSISPPARASSYKRATEHQQAGSLIAEVSSSLNGATIHRYSQ